MHQNLFNLFLTSIIANYKGFSCCGEEYNTIAPRFSQLFCLGECFTEISTYSSSLLMHFLFSHFRCNVGAWVLVTEAGFGRV